MILRAHATCKTALHNADSAGRSKYNETNATDITNSAWPVNESIIYVGAVVSLPH